jgi:hypothetical protein
MINCCAHDRVIGPSTSMEGMIVAKVLMSSSDTPSIFNLFILLMLSLLLWLLRSNLCCSSSLLKLLHHIATVILRRLHFSLLFQLVHFKFKLLDFSLQMIIFSTYSLITSFHKLFLNTSTRSININVIASFRSFACRGLGSFGIT